ncbi:hypothetical protein VPH35_037678 [Triticum aestivum]
MQGLLCPGHIRSCMSPRRPAPSPASAPPRGLLLLGAAPGGPVRATAPATSPQTCPVVAATSSHATQPWLPVVAAPLQSRPPEAPYACFYSLSTNGPVVDSFEVAPVRPRPAPAGLSRVRLPASAGPPHAGSGSRVAPRLPGPSPPPARCPARRPRLQPGQPPPLPRRVPAAGFYRDPAAGCCDIPASCTGCCRDPAAGWCGIPASCAGRLRPATRPAGSARAGFADDPACRLPSNPDAGLWRDPAVGFRRVPLLPAHQAENKENREKKSQASS